MNYLLDFTHFINMVKKDYHVDEFTTTDKSKLGGFDLEAFFYHYFIDMGYDVEDYDQKKRAQGKDLEEKTM